MIGKGLKEVLNLMSLRRFASVCDISDAVGTRTSSQTTDSSSCEKVENKCRDLGYGVKQQFESLSAELQSRFGACYCWNQISQSLRYKERATSLVCTR